MKLRKWKGWAIVSKNGKLAVERVSWGNVFIIGPTRSDARTCEAYEKTIEVEVRELPSTKGKP